MKRMMMWGVQILTEKKDRRVDDHTIVASRAEAERLAAMLDPAAQPKVTRVLCLVPKGQQPGFHLET